MHDLISRQAAINALRTITMYKNSIPFDTAVMKLQKLPSAEKRGRWINDRLISTSGGTYGVKRCSECEAYYQNAGYSWHYCPDCGAKMEDDND